MTVHKRKRTKKVKQPADTVSSPLQKPTQWDGLEPGSASPVLPHSWLWDQVILEFGLNLIEGRKGAGKSSVMAAIAAHVTGGPTLPGCEQQDPRPVLWSGPEEGWATAVLGRLAAAGADTSYITRLRLFTDSMTARKLTLPSGIEEFTRILRLNRVALVVFDPLGSMADPGLDLRTERDARLYLEPLADAMVESGATAILSRHLRKGAGGDPLDAGLGGVGVGNTCRTIWRCDRHPEDDGVRVFCPVANNYGPSASSLLYRLSVVGGAVRVEWGGKSELSADALVEGRRGAADIDEGRDAITLLRALLGEGGKQALTVISEARASGVGERSLRAAKAALRVLSERRSMGQTGEAAWYWMPPKGGFPSL